MNAAEVADLITRTDMAIGLKMTAIEEVVAIGTAGETRVDRASSTALIESRINRIREAKGVEGKWSAPATKAQAAWIDHTMFRAAENERLIAHWRKQCDAANAELQRLMALPNAEQ